MDDEKSNPDMSPAALSALNKGDFKAFHDASVPGGIERAEAAAAKDMMEKSNLPMDGLIENREVLEKIGFVFGEYLDEVLISVTMPNGWSIVRDKDNPYDARHMAMLDNFGRKRAHVFLKSTSYDYCGYVQWCYAIQIKKVRLDNSDKVFYTEPSEKVLSLAVSVVQGEKVLFQTDKVTAQRSDIYDALEPLEKLAEAWCRENFPNFLDPFSYWEDDAQEVKD